jgi:drug/metabolite transporter (DMT)-like permease
MTPAAKATALLVANGAVIATNTILARGAAGAGVAPLLYAFASAFGAALALGAFRATRGPVSIPSRVARYGAIAGLVSVAVPQALIYSASAYVSAGIASLAYAFPTPLTFALAALFGLERATPGRAVGIALAFAGAVLLALSRTTGLSGDALWVGLAMLAPIAIAGGNIYRPRYWPPGAEPLDLAVAMSGGGALWLLLALLVTGGLALPSPTGAGYLALAALVATGGNVMYFELQRTGGIVSFSQIGYVGAVLGLLGGVALLGERYAALTWIAAGVIAVGVALSEVMKRREA